MDVDLIGKYVYGIYPCFDSSIWLARRARRPGVLGAVGRLEAKTK